MVSAAKKWMSAPERNLLWQVSVDTACSSALVGAHLGMQHLRSHRGSVLAAGVNLMLAETTTAAAQVAGMLTLDGRCKTMDASADGYVRCGHLTPHVPTHAM